MDISHQNEEKKQKDSIVDRQLHVLTDLSPASVFKVVNLAKE